MQFSAKEYYGLRAMAEWARRYGDGPVSVSEVAEIQGLSPAYLEQIIPSLRESGLLASTRGAHGGYALTRPPKEISVADVIRALEGAVVHLRCTEEADACERMEQCVTRTVWERVYNLVTQTLQGMTLADLV